jgi:hypothetical protein
MEFTTDEQNKLSVRTRSRIEKAVNSIVDWSYTVRPMAARTASEDKRRRSICADFWRRQVSQGIEVGVAAQNLPTLLVAAIDHEEDGKKVSSILDGEFQTGMYPSERDQKMLIEPERSLSAFAKLRKK